MDDDDAQAIIGDLMQVYCKGIAESKIEFRGYEIMSGLNKLYTKRRKEFGKVTRNMRKKLWSK
jgi:hypothetical protein